jgi:phospholipid/cholesterol/gamma-HCH transport system substrate-binding protein
MSRPTRLVRMALLVVLLLLTPGCVPQIGPGFGKDTMTITALFPDAAGLFVGNDVGVLGVPVGTVTAIEPEGDHVRVSLEVDADRRFPADVGAVVVARSVATDRYVELTPVYHQGPTLQDGAVIARDRTRSPVDFDQVLEAINRFSTGIAGSQETLDAVRRFIDTGSTALDGQGKQLNRSVTSLADAVNGVSGQRQEITGTLTALDQLVATIATNEQTVRTFVRQVSRATGQLAAERGDFRSALRSLDRAVTAIARFAVDNRGAVIRSIGSSTDVMRSLMRKQRQMAEILEVMPVALENISRLPVKRRLPVRTNPLILAPFSDELTGLCDLLPFGLCDVLAGTDLGLGALLGGGTP